MSILYNLFFFIVALGLLVTFHEFGHYWVARMAGVRVLRFSVGFGKSLYSWKRHVDGADIEYVIASLPLGGYVKMLDEREGDVAEEDLHKAFNRQSLFKRTAIVSAGPIFNFILAIILYSMVFVIGTTAERPLLGAATPDSVAEVSGFKSEDEVVSVNGDEVRSWSEFRLELIEHGLDGGDVSIIVDDIDGSRVERTLALGDIKLLKDEGDMVAHLGFMQWWPDLPPVIGGVTDDGAAREAGLQAGDEILSVGGTTIRKWGEVVEQVKTHPAKPLDFVVVREAQQVSVTVIPKARTVEKQEQGFIGAYQTVPQEIKDRLLVKIEYGVVDSILKASERTWEMSVLTLRVLWQMLSGDASLTNISGPITIAKYAGVTAQIGLTTYLGFLAIISLSLGVINLLPIPMLDGGHLMYYLIEMLKGSPVSEAFELRGQQVGMVLLALLMCLAIFNDFQRLMQ